MDLVTAFKESFREAAGFDLEDILHPGQESKVPVPRQTRQEAVAAEGGTISNPEVSVIIPTYNRWNYLPETVDSFLAQTFDRPYEILVVDDGGTDGTFEKLQERYRAEIQRGRLRVFRKENGGQSSVRNLGLREAKGDKICFQDDDDIALPHKLKVLSDYLDAHPKVGMVHARSAQIDQYGNPYPAEKDEVARYYRKVHSDPSKLTYQKLLEGNFVHAQTMMARREVFDAVGKYDEHLVVSPDYDLWIRVMEKFPLEFLDSVVVHYRRHPQCITVNNVEKRRKTVRTIRNKASVRSTIGMDPNVLMFLTGKESGLGRAAFDQAEALFQQGITNITLVMKDGWYVAKPHVYARPVNTDIFHPNHRGQASPFYQDLGNWRKYSTFDEFIRSLDFTPNLVHLNNNNCTVQEIPCFREMRVPIVYTCHCLDAYREQTDGIDRSNEKRLQRETLISADAVVALSEPYARLIAQYYPGADGKMIVSPNGVMVPDKNPRRNMSGSPRLLAVGRLHPEKGHQVILGAMKYVLSQFPDATLDIAGGGGYRDELDRIRKREGLEGKVRLLGHISDPDKLRALYQGATMLIQPSLNDNQPYTVLDAMAYGVPVIASKVGGIPDLIQDGVSGVLVVPNDSISLAKAINDGLTNRKRLESLASAGYMRARDRFSLEASGKRMVELYTRLLTR